MANRTVKYANSVHGVNPQYLIEKIIRERIYDSRYWQEECFLLTSALVLERAVDDLKYIGGTYGAKIDPTPFLCLILKLLQIQPDKDIIYLYIEQSDFKYLRALGAFYLRLVGRPVEIYTKLEPLYNDYRKLRIMDNQRNFTVIHMDEFVDNLLREEKIFNISVPRLTRRYVLEDNRDIEPYKSKLEDQNLIPKQLLEDEIDCQDKGQRNRSHHKSTSEDRLRDTKNPTQKDRYYNRRDRDRSDDGRRHQTRSRSKSPPQLNVEKHIPSKYSSCHSRFSQVEIDNENAIRAKVGLRPLR